MSALRRLSERFWFIPTLLCLGASVLAEVLVAVDETVDDTSVPAWVRVFLYRVGESGSRDILGAIATSSLAVAGTTFSITIAVLALTSSTYGPRLVRNFMADRGNQVVLGVYVATFLYSLLVLRSIRVPGDPGDQEAEVFVPHLAVNGAVLLALANVAVLVYFIHHISDSIQVATLARRVRGDLTATVDRLYPADLGDEPDPGAEAQLPTTWLGRPITADASGYVLAVRQEHLVEAAVEHDVVVALQVRPGQYVLPGTVVALTHPATADGDGLADAVRASLAVGESRTPHQDVAFAVQQLTEMAVRALSPGTNDPYTAINALDDLSAGLTMLAARDLPSPVRSDAEGKARVHAPGLGTVEVVRPVVDAMRWYAASAPSVMHTTLDLLERVGSATRSAAVRAELARQVDLLQDAFDGAQHRPEDTDRFTEHAARVRVGLGAAEQP